MLSATSQTDLDVSGQGSRHDPVLEVRTACNSTSHEGAAWTHLVPGRQDVGQCEVHDLPGQALPLELRDRFGVVEVDDITLDGVVHEGRHLAALPEFVAGRGVVLDQFDVTHGCHLTE